MYTWKLPCDRLGILSISSILPQILPQTSSQTQGNSRVSRMEHQTPSVFPGNFRRKRKVLGTLCFPFCFPENLAEPNATPRLDDIPTTSRRQESHGIKSARPSQCACVERLQRPGPAWRRLGPPRSRRPWVMAPYGLLGTSLYLHPLAPCLFVSCRSPSIRCAAFHAGAPPGGKKATQARRHSDTHRHTPRPARGPAERQRSFSQSHAARPCTPLTRPLPPRSRAI